MSVGFLGFSSFKRTPQNGEMVSCEHVRTAKFSHKKFIFFFKKNALYPGKKAYQRKAVCYDSKMVHRTLVTYKDLMKMLQNADCFGSEENGF